MAYRQVGELGQYDFVPTQGQAESDKAYPQPAGSKRFPAPATVALPTTVQQPDKLAPAEPPIPPCVATKMAAYDAQRDKEIEQLGEAARAQGEELQISAGSEDLMRQEALAKSTADCK